MRGRAAAAIRAQQRTVASLMTFKEHGIVVSVLSNVSDADTPGLALTIANAFVEPRSYAPH